MKAGHIAAALLLSLTGLAPARAGLLLDFTGGFGTAPSGDTVAGWEFRVSVPTAVTALGFWDEDADGFARGHEVGLWNAAGTLLARTTVDGSCEPAASTSTDGRWMFKSVDRLILDPGLYVVGATYLDDDPDLARLMTRKWTTGVASYVRSVQTMSSRLARPDTPLDNLNAGIFGPNLRVSAVPEPATALPAAVAAVVGLALRSSGVRPGRRCA